MNPALARLHAYPFERLDKLLSGCTVPAALPHIGMSIGEPKHAPPPQVLEVLAANLHRIDSYPATRGLPALRQAMAAALHRRLLPPSAIVDADTMVLPVNGTREALFAIVQAVVDPKPGALVAMPNPCYQIYEGAAILAGAQPWYLDTVAENGFMPDLDAVPPEIWDRCQLLFLCSPGNPAGAVLPLDYLQRTLALAEKHDFVIATDECYADLYLDESAPPPSLLRAAWAAGRHGFERCLVFHSLSKRSSLPGLRSGLVAGDAALINRFLLYRTYHGSAMPVPTQLASIAAWQDDAHVIANRALYREKFARVIPLLDPVLEVEQPAGGFYLWPRIAGDDATFARALHQAKNVTLLPGSFLARDNRGDNPGRGRLRISLVAGVDDCVEAAARIRDFISGR